MSQKYVFRVEGMSCSGCATGIVKSLSRSSGVELCEVDFESKRAIVTTSMSPMDVEELIESMGYEAVLVVQK